MSSEARDDVRELRRLFFRRFFDNEVLAPNGGGEDKIGLVYAALVVPGFLITAPLLMKFDNRYISAGRRMIIALDDKLLFITVSMLVMGLVALAVWDALALDAQDIAILGSLPLTRATIVRSKLEAIALYAATVAVALNGLPSMLFPAVFLGPLDLGLLRFLGLAATHAAVTMAAGAFGFFVVFACRQVVSIALPQRLSRAVSAWVQGGLLLAAVTALLLAPGAQAATKRIDAARKGLVVASPPVWFLGVYETSAARLVMDSPAVLGESKRGTLNFGEEARRRYLADLPLFGRLGSLALWSLTALVALTLCAYVVEAGRLARLRTTFSGYLPSWLGRAVTGVAQRAIVRDPLARATFFFTFQTLARGAAQRLYFLSGMAVTTAMAVVFFPVSELIAVVRGDGGLTSGVIGLELFLLFAVVQTARLVVAIPADLRANWIFRLTWPGELAPYVSGVRRAVFVMALVPLVTMMPAHILTSGLSISLIHAVFGLLAGVGAVELCFRDLRIVPFTCSLGSGRFSGVPTNGVTWLLAASALVALELWALQAPTNALVGIASTMTCVGALVFLGRRKTRGRDEVVFDAPEDMPTVRLGLSEID